MNTYLEVEELFNTGSATEYLGEAVMLTEHMLQCAQLAKHSGAPDYLILAALLHDIGHLIVSDPMQAQDSNIDLHHDEIGANWIAQRFPREVSDPVRLHVSAKRYLVATDSSYGNKLSPASTHTLKLQGGPFTAEQCQEFSNLPGAVDAIKIRHWDDQGKSPEKEAILLSEFREIIEGLAFSIH